MITGLTSRKQHRANESCSDNMRCRQFYGAHWVCLVEQRLFANLLDESPGCYDLAAVEESIVLAFSKAGNDDPNHLNVALNRAYRVSFVG